jgi:hypothetical protein
MSKEKLIQYAFYAAAAYGAYWLWQRYQATQSVRQVAATQEEMLTISQADMAQAVASFQPL